MLLNADIILEKRSIISWLFNPVFGATNIVDTQNVKDSATSWFNAIWSAPGAIRSWLVDVGALRTDPKTSDATGSEKT